AQRLENDYEYAEPEGQFLVLEVKMLNKTQSSIDMSNFEWGRFNLEEFDGTQYELQSGAMEVIPDNQNLVNQFGFLASLSPKIERTMYFVYDIPKNVTTAYTVNLPGTTNTQVDTIMGKIDRAIQNDKQVTITIN
ncbi:MAG: hypothetical protein N4A48_12290, partial [Tepidibacter sp.]|uniref:hypothetical protein n=1 Tax=Tepidibacter sp. TaxID=2529387 RepID=UPI0025F5F4DD